jgi:hypothetical protein
VRTGIADMVLLIRCMSEEIYIYIESAKSQNPHYMGGHLHYDTPVGSSSSMHTILSVE